MSIQADTFVHFCKPIYRERMSYEERADLLIDMYDTLGYEEYDKYDKNGKYLGPDTETIIKELKEFDKKNKS